MTLGLASGSPFVLSRHPFTRVRDAEDTLDSRRPAPGPQSLGYELRECSRRLDGRPLTRNSSGGRKRCRFEMLVSPSGTTVDKLHPIAKHGWQNSKNFPAQLLERRMAASRPSPFDAISQTTFAWHPGFEPIHESNPRLFSFRAGPLSSGSIGKWRRFCYGALPSRIHAAAVATAATSSPLRAAPPTKRRWRCHPELPTRWRNSCSVLVKQLFPMP